jgi:hypothetical protein
VHAVRGGRTHEEIDQADARVRPSVTVAEYRRQKSEDRSSETHYDTHVLLRRPETAASSTAQSAVAYSNWRRRPMRSTVAEPAKAPMYEVT